MLTAGVQLPRHLPPCGHVVPAPGAAATSTLAEAFALRYALSVLPMGHQREGHIASGARLLVVHDAADPIRDLLSGSEVVSEHAPDSPAVWAAVDSGRVDAVLLALDWSAGAALELLAQLRERRPDLPVLVMAAPDELAEPVARDHGASAVVPMDADQAVLLHAVRSALLLRYGGDEDPSPPSGPELLGQTRQVDRLRTQIQRAAPGEATILIRGETGTGKELVARAIHRASQRAGGPLVTIHCAALPETLLESELFGHEKGAFTGAYRRTPGRLELAQGGTLFLDEIGDITPATQVKLLRVLQERAYERLGGRETLRADVRFVAATHRDLDQCVKDGTFREDLFYRLNVVPIWVPPLRARRDDIVLLATHFCGLFAAANASPGATLSAGALAHLRGCRWPGNVRQLQNLVERLVVLGSGGAISAEDVQQELAEGAPFATDGGDLSTSISVASQAAVATPSVVPLEETLRRAERRAVMAALDAAHGNRSQAARLLGISRASLYNKLKAHGLS